MSLTKHQQEAYDEVYARLAEGETYTGLRGYAGTGKTYLVSRLIEQLVDEGCTVSVCAPTHKAVQVLSQELGDAPVQLQTLHSFLGLRLKPDEDGGYQLVPEMEERDYPEGVVIVDEASMIGREEWQYIELAAQRDLMQRQGVQWIFVGDPAQLPPVNEDPSPALEVPGPMLEEIHRQAADNPILELATQIRKDECERFRSRYENGQGVAITHNREGFLDSVLRTFDTDAFDENAMYARLLAYRNRTVRHYNREIRTARYGEDAPRFEPGEWLVARETWYHDGETVLLNSEEVRVKKATVDTYEADDLSEWTVWKLKLRKPGQGMARTAMVLHEDEFERYENELEKRRMAAKDDRRKWERFYDLRERFARVDYAYASTVHKCLPEDARIETERGSRPIGDVEEGDLVWTGKNRLRQVIGKFHTGPKRVLQIRTQSGSVFRSSQEHRFLTQRGWVEAQHLDPRDTIALARPTLDAFGEHREMGEAYLMGYLVGDGSYNYDSNRVDVCLHKKSPLKAYIRSLLSRRGNVGEVSKAPPSNSMTLWVEDKSFRQKLKRRGMQRTIGPHKQCPRLYSEEERRSFLRGLFDADGSASETRAVVRLVSTSHRLIQQVKAMLLRFGVASYVYSVATPEQASNAWVLSVTGPSILPFARHISFRHPKKRARLERVIANVGGKTNRDFVPHANAVRDKLKQAFPKYEYGDTMRISWNGDQRTRRALMGRQKNLSWNHLETVQSHLQKRGIDVPPRVEQLLETKHYYDPVESVHMTDAVCEMVDIEVAEDHSYVYRGAVVHNSQGSTFDTVFVDHRDLRACRGDERDALLYVAVTRPARRLALLV